MAIRSAAKAVIIKDGMVLLNRCRHRDGREYYDLPGGGQRQYEAMEDAVRREVLEETGYALKSLRFAALAEEIFTYPEYREKYPDYSHRVLHIFAAELADASQKEPTAPDMGMEKSVWTPVAQVAQLAETYPGNLAALVDNIVKNGPPMFLGVMYR